MHNAKYTAAAIRAGILIASLISSLPAHAERRTIWSIGTFNASSGEFHSHDVDYTSPASDLVFTVGKNTEKDWYRFQPGPANGMTGSRLHPITLKFTLNDVPQGLYYLRVAILYETPRLSFLKLDVNGHCGFFYFHPKLDFHAGDWEGTFVPQTSTDEKTIAIPASWLQRGENTLVFTAMDDPATPQTSLGAIAPGHTGLIYDALELTQDSTARYNDHVLHARVEPTIFYKQSRNTGLTEVVDVFTSASALPRGGTVELSIAGKKQQQTFKTQSDFGELRFTFDVPEWQGQTPASVRLNDQSTPATTVLAAKKWTLAVIPHEHLDVGFTDYPAKVAELHSQSIDEAMQLIRKTPDFRWTLDGSWVANQYLNARSKDAQQEFLSAVRAGSIVIPPEFANQHTGNASWEGLARSLYNRHQLAHALDLAPSDAAQTVDVPTYTWAYASVLHDAGIKYFIGASNSWRAPIMLLGRWNEKSPFYWEGPDGGRVLMWYSRAYLQGHTLFGSPWRLESVRDALPVFLQAYTRPDYSANTAIIFGTQLENTPLAKEQSEIVSAVASQYVWPKFQFSTVRDAMQHIEREWKGQFPVYRGDFGPYWEDGYGSDAAHTAIHRENQHRIATAEILGASVTSIDPRVHPDRAMLADAWWNELTYDEHTWTYVGATTQPENHQSEDQIALKGFRTERARNDIDESIKRGWAQLEALVKPRDNSVIVFNSLNWLRSGYVETDLPDGSTLVDTASGSAVPVEILFRGKGIPLPGFGPGNVRVRFLATGVPALGYRLYAVKPLANPSPVGQPLQGDVVENQFYRLTIDPTAAAITSIVDRQSGRELVDAGSPYRFGSYLYVTGGDDYPNNSLYRFGAGLAAPRLTVHSAGSGTLVSAKRSALGTTIVLAASAPNTPKIEFEIFLPESEKKILLTYRLHKDRVFSRESAYIAFPFAAKDPRFAYGSQSAWVDPAKDELPGGSREWYVPTTWAAISDQTATAAIVPLDAPLVNFGDIVRGNWPSEFQPKSATIFSWLMNNYWGTNFPAWQGGDYTFRYALITEAQFDPPALTRFALNALTPLERDDIAGTTDTSALPNRSASLLNISGANVDLLTWKVAEDDDGTILRLQESAGKPAVSRISSDFVAVRNAWLCSALEDNRSRLNISGDAVEVELKPFQVVTIRIHTTPKFNAAVAEKGKLHE